MRGVVTSLRDKLAAVVTGLGYEIVGCELLRSGHGSLLRIYIDSENGVTVDDCGRVSLQISAMLDVEDPIAGPYTLEVSSPGIDRPLFDIAHFEKYVGRKIKVKLRVPMNARRHFVGLLLRVEDMNIHLVIDGENAEVVLPFSDIEKAKLMG